MIKSNRMLALELGLKTYRSDKSCPRSHDSHRFVSSGNCIECSKASFRNWHANNRDRSINKSKKWRENNYDRHLAYARVQASIYYAENRDAALQYAKKYRSIDDNRKKCIERARDWGILHPDRMKEHGKIAAGKRRTRKTGAGGRFNRADILKLFDSQGGKCAYFKVCGSDFRHTKFEIDHMLPVARGGSSWPWNLQLLCRSCNGRKSARLKCEFEALIGFAA